MLAGGAASRFGGRPKGLERVGGERIVDRVARVLEEVTGTRPILIANASDAPTWCPALKTVPDLLPQRGTLSGIYTAVTAGDGPVLVAAWDMPFVPRELLAALVRGAGGYDVFLPESGGRRGVEPLCGVYGPACVAAIRARIDLEDFRAVGFHEAVRVGTLALTEVAQYGDVDTMFFNVNTADDLEHAEALCQRRA